MPRRDFRRHIHGRFAVREFTRALRIPRGNTRASRRARRKSDPKLGSEDATRPNLRNNQ